MRIDGAKLLLILVVITGPVLGVERAPNNPSDRLELPLPIEGAGHATESRVVFRDESVKWGGEGIVLTTGKNWASMEFGCARATIPGGIKPVHRGKFNVRGVYTPLTAIRTNEPPKSWAIRAEGRISGNRMTLKLTKIENGDVIGTYSLERGKNVRLYKCM